MSSGTVISTGEVNALPALIAVLVILGREVRLLARRHRLLVPEARAALDSMKDRVVDEKQVQLPDGDGGNLTTREAGARGGEIGGSMVQKLIEVAEKTLVSEHKIPPQED